MATDKLWIGLTINQRRALQANVGVGVLLSATGAFGGDIFQILSAKVFGFSPGETATIFAALSFCPPLVLAGAFLVARFGPIRILIACGHVRAALLVLLVAAPSVIAINHALGFSYVLVALLLCGVCHALLYSPAWPVAIRAITESDTDRARFLSSVRILIQITSIATFAAIASWPASPFSMLVTVCLGLAAYQLFFSSRIRAIEFPGDRAQTSNFDATPILTVLRDRRFQLLLLASALSRFCDLPLFSQIAATGLGFELAEVGLFNAGRQVGLLLGVLVAGYLVARFSLYPVLVASIVMSGGGLLWIAMAIMNSTPATHLAPTIIGVGAVVAASAARLLMCFDLLSYRLAVPGAVPQSFALYAVAYFVADGMSQATAGWLYGALNYFGIGAMDAAGWIVVSRVGVALALLLLCHGARRYARLAEAG